MSKAYAVAFVAIAGLAVIGVDYSIQARTTGAGLTGLGPGGYVESIKSRYGQQQADRAAAQERKDLLALDERELLPPAPEGWVRRDYTDADRALLDAAPDPMSLMTPDAMASPLTAMVNANTEVMRRKEQREIYVYERDGALIALRMSYRKPEGPQIGMTGVATQIVAGNIAAMSAADAYALVRGIPFREELGLFGMGAEERDYRVFSASIGGEVRLGVNALAPDEDILALLDSIDYDRLNAMLTEPVTGIGSQAPDIDPVLGAEIAEQMVAAERAATVARGAAQEARLQGIGSTMQDPQASGIAKATSLLGAMFGSGEKEAEAAATEARTAVGDIRVNRSAGTSGFGNCTTEGGVRRCRIGE